MVRELKQGCVTVLWQAPRLAQFIGLDPVAVEHAEAAEAVMLWIFNTVDTELARRIQAQGGDGTQSRDLRHS